MTPIERIRQVPERRPERLGIYDQDGKLIRELREGTDWQRHPTNYGEFVFTPPPAIPSGAYLVLFDVFGRPWPMQIPICPQP